MSQDPDQSSAAASAPAERSPRAVIGFPRIAILAAIFAMLTATPFAWSSWWFTTIYLLPIAFIVWVVRTRTVADADGLTARTVFAERRLPWSDLRGLAITDRSQVRAVTTGGEEIALPTVRTRHLPLLSAVSGGRIPDPSASQES